MTSHPMWMLTIDGDTLEVSAGSITASHERGALGEAVVRVDAVNQNAECWESAQVATEAAYDVLYREGYADGRQIIAHFDGDATARRQFGAMTARSAELILALALIRAVAAPKGWSPPALAATGFLRDDGSIGAVDGLSRKLRKALEVLPPGGAFICPAENGRQLSEADHALAADRGVELIQGRYLAQVLRKLSLPLSNTWQGNPFRGLEPFRYSDAAVFFGRDAQVHEVLAKLRKHGAVLVLGASGSGKSSLAQAGVLPRLVRSDPGRCSWGVLRPGAVSASAAAQAERSSLLEALCRAWYHEEEGSLGTLPPVDRPALTGPEFVAWLKRHDGGSDSRYVLLLDQMEEWFSGSFQPATVEALLQLLIQLRRLGVWLLGTRASGTGQDPPAMRELFGDSRYRLEEGAGSRLLWEIIHRPAEAAGLRYEAVGSGADPTEDAAEAQSLDALILDEAVGGGRAVLPLLELLLTELYLRRDAPNGVLTVSAYRALGGLEGIINSRAEEVYRRCPPDEQALVPQLLWRLLLCEGSSDGLRLADYPAPHSMHRLVQAYRGVTHATACGSSPMAGRLLVEDHGIVRPAHAAFLGHWERAVLFRQNQEGSLLRWKVLAAEARQWRNFDRALMSPGPQLHAAARLLATHRPLFTKADDDTLDYIRRSLARRRMLIAAAAGLSLVVTGVGLAWLQYDRARQAATAGTFPRILGRIPAGKAPRVAALSPDGTELYVLSAGDSTLRIIDTRTNKLVATRRTLDRPNAIAFSGDGSKAYIGLVAAQSITGGRIQVFDTRRREPAPLPLTVPGTQPCMVSDMARQPGGAKLYAGFVYCGLYRLDTATDKLSALAGGLCPEGIAFTRQGDRAYVSYQCAPDSGLPGHARPTGGHDPIFIYDARTDRLVDAIDHLRPDALSDPIPNVGSYLAISQKYDWAVEYGIDACANPAYNFKGCPVDKSAEVEPNGYVKRGLMNIIDLTPRVVHPITFPFKDSIDGTQLGPLMPTFLADGRTVAISTQGRLLFFDIGIRMNDQPVMKLSMQIPRAGNLVLAGRGNRGYVTSETQNVVYVLALGPDPDFGVTTWIGDRLRSLWSWAG